MPMSSGGRVASSSECATRPKVREIGLTGYAVPTRRSLLIGRYVMATAEHREPCDSRGSCTVLGAPGGETPPGDSTESVIRRCRPQCPVCPRKRTYLPISELLPPPALGERRHRGLARRLISWIGVQSSWCRKQHPAAAVTRSLHDAAH